LEACKSKITSLENQYKAREAELESEIDELKTRAKDAENRYHSL